MEDIQPQEDIQPLTPDFFKIHCEQPVCDSKKGTGQYDVMSKEVTFCMLLAGTVCNSDCTQCIIAQARQNQTDIIALIAPEKGVC